MLHSKNTITAKMKKKNIDRFLAVLFFVLVTAGALGNIFGIGYSIALAQQQAQQPTTITYDPPLNNNLSTADPGNTQDHKLILLSKSYYLS
jgi:hypothetical protein